MGKSARAASARAEIAALREEIATCKRGEKTPEAQANIASCESRIKYLQDVIDSDE